MKHLKTFESFSINEEEGLWSKTKKVFTGYESKEEKEEAKAKLEAELDKLEEEGVSVSKERVMKLAKDNDYLGTIKVVKDVATYVDGKSPIQKAATGTRYATQRS